MHNSCIFAFLTKKKLIDVCMLVGIMRAFFHFVLDIDGIAEGLILGMQVGNLSFTLYEYLTRFESYYIAA